MENHDVWEPLSARIRALVDTGRFAANIFGNYNDNRVMNAFGNHAKAILSDLNALANSMEEEQSLKGAEASARTAITRVSNEVTPLLYETGNTGDLWKINVRASLVLLAALEGEVTYILRDSQEGIRSLTERAFEHLNRTIVVDSSFRERWQAAYQHNEPACEALG